MGIITDTIDSIFGGSKADSARDTSLAASNASIQNREN